MLLSVLGGCAVPRKAATRVLAGMQAAKAASLAVLSTLTRRGPPVLSPVDLAPVLSLETARVAAASRSAARDALGWGRLRLGEGWRPDGFIRVARGSVQPTDGLDREDVVDQPPADELEVELSEMALSAGSREPSGGE